MRIKKQKILIVDDVEDIAIVLRDFITKLGYEVKIVSDGQSALEIVKNENFDLVLLDLAMPQLDGIEVLKKIKVINKETKVVIITAYRDAEKVVEAFRNGAKDCLFKPFNLKSLKNVLESSLKNSIKK